MIPLIACFISLASVYLSIQASSSTALFISIIALVVNVFMVLAE